MLTQDQLQQIQKDTLISFGYFKPGHGLSRRTVVVDHIRKTSKGVRIFAQHPTTAEWGQFDPIRMTDLSIGF